MKKWLLILLIVIACTEIVYINSQDFLVIVEANTSWRGKIDTFTVTSKSDEDIRWFKVNRPVCWEITHTGTSVGMVRAYGTTPNFTYGWALEEKKYPMWGDQNNYIPGSIIRGCIPEDAKY